MPHLTIVLFLSLLFLFRKKTSQQCRDSLCKVLEKSEFVNTNREEVKVHDIMAEEMNCSPNKDNKTHVHGICCRVCHEYSLSIYFA